MELKIGEIMHRNEFPSYTYSDDKGVIHLCPNDAAVGLIEIIDIDSQIRAINHIFSIIDKGEKGLNNEIVKNQYKLKAIKNEITYNHQENEVIDTIHHSVYFDAAKSLNTVSMLAPLLESVFIEIFKNIQLKFNDIIDPKFDEIRCNHKQKWNCKYYFKNGIEEKGIAKGIIELSEITGLSKYAPAELEKILSIIFTYRNFILHNGMEWCDSEKRKFQNKIKDQEWPNNWISFSKINEQPWIYYLTDDFRYKALKCLEKLITGVGKLYLELSNIKIN